MSSDLFERHRRVLDGALDAIVRRACWSAYPEVPSGKVYGETARDDGTRAFEALIGHRFPLRQPGEVDAIAPEHSPYGRALDIAYGRCDVDALLRASAAAGRAWAKTDPSFRAGICLEILHRLNRRSFEMANAVMHTTGQGFMMAFQAGGPHAQDRGLEAVAWAFDAMRRCPEHATWRKQVGREEYVTLEKAYRVVPRGIAVVMACSTFPTWNSYPGLFASLVTGNTVVVKPHPGAVLPLAITVSIARDVLRECGAPEDVVTLLVDDHATPIGKVLCADPRVGIIDYTGGPAFGTWLEENVRHARLYTEKAGVNAIVLDSMPDLRAVTGNIAFTLSLYSGQMCTTSQNIFVPQEGVRTGSGAIGFDAVGAALGRALDGLLGDAGRAAEVLGAIQNEATLDRIAAARAEAVARGRRILREAAPVEHPGFPGARISSPLLIELDEADADLYEREVFGPIAYVIRTRSTTRSVEIASRIAREKGMITASIYSTDIEVQDAAVEALVNAGAAVSCNLTGAIWVNQSAAFSDFHVSGANPAGNATLCDADFIAGRFRVGQSRVLVPQPATVGA
ncbi:MAG: phenylacetic acid degradation protein PaaN [Phycisphaeraceae bacterium]|nr:phenylacetic acid degradation protein PaaN [Phycisphaeraceae bacterium]